MDGMDVSYLDSAPSTNPTNVDDFLSINSGGCGHKGGSPLSPVCLVVRIKQYDGTPLPSYL